MEEMAEGTHSLSVPAALWAGSVLQETVFLGKVLEHLPSRSHPGESQGWE